MRNRTAIVSVILAALLVTLGVAGCGRGGGDEPLSVAVIYIGGFEENNWSYQGHAGAQSMAYSLEYVRLSEKENVDADEAAAVMREYAEDGFDIIFCHSFDYGAAVAEVAQEYPEVIFMWCTGDVALYDNVGLYDGRIYEPRYLAGIVAGNITASNRIGFVAAVPEAQVVTGINAFARGVAAENPDAVVYVEWTLSWYNPAAEDAAAQSLVDRGCDVIVHHTDSCVPGHVADENGVCYMSLNADCAKEAPLSFMAAAYYDWEPVMTDIVEAGRDGSWSGRPGRDWWYGMGEGGVLLSPMSDLAPDDLKARIEGMAAEIESGGILVFPNMSDSRIRSMNYLEANVSGSIPQKPIEDGGG
ncbi:MAG: BMP family ABC transporter substrate-binding protein [Dehalococcoidia bacterium]|jgi:basic membrane protein A